ASIFYQRHAFEFRFGLDRRERDRLRQRLVRYRGDGHPWLAFGCGRIGERFPGHLGDADNLFLVARVVEDKLVAFFHFAEMAARGEITHAGPCLALGSALDLVIPGILIRLGLQQPVRHVTIPIWGVLSATTRWPRRHSFFPPVPRRRRLRSACRHSL